MTKAYLGKIVAGESTLGETAYLIEIEFTGPLPRWLRTMGTEVLVAPKETEVYTEEGEES